MSVCWNMCTMVVTFYFIDNEFYFNGFALMAISMKTLRNLPFSPSSFKYASGDRFPAGYHSLP